MGTRTVLHGLAAAVMAAACGGDGATPAGPSATLVIVSGGAQNDTIGARLPQPLRVRAMDASGRALAGAPVRFTVEEGDVTLSSGTATTDALGEAETSATLGETAGFALVVAMLQDGGSRIEFQLGILPGAPIRLEPVEQPPPAWFAENRLLDVVAARATDRTGNAVGSDVAPARWTVVRGGGEALNYPLIEGLHQARWTLGPELGEQTIRLTVRDLSIDFSVGAVEGGRIAFASDREAGNNQWDIFTMKPDGTDLIRLTASDHRDKDTEWSPDRRQVLFARVFEGELEGGLWTVPADGGADALAMPGNAGGGAWSPDGTRVAYFTKGGAPNCPIAMHEIWLRTLDGSGSQKLIEDPCGGGGTWPEWAPDGSQIVYESREGSGDRNLWRLWTARPDGSDRRRITEDPAHQAQWSPDGSTIIFGAFVPANAAIRRVSPAGGASHVVWDPDDDGLLHVLPGGFSPDGSFLVAEVGWDLPGAKADIFLVHLETGRAWDITHRKEGFDGFPVW
ncbi:MAG TPA: Ig-like domain-containing protein [Candidatus Limnocylindria bacterium]|nr:Ig-like domain-containing protein [Candidatus Limnocylindria bacterium]